MPNRLAHEKSPYLLQHANNPVDWFPWGAEAFEKARSENKPIFLSIGYSTCHWCHVMERESFENDAIAALLNKDYVAIKLDREERPDIDRVYMTFKFRRPPGSGGLAYVGLSDSRVTTLLWRHLLSARRIAGARRALVRCFRRLPPHGSRTVRALKNQRATSSTG